MAREFQYARVLSFIRKHVASHGSWPSNRLICDACDLMPWRVGSIFDQLRSKGLITRSRNEQRRGGQRVAYDYQLADGETIRGGGHA